MNLAAVRVAPVDLLAQGAVAAARNVRGLVDDAVVLSQADRPARAYALAVLAVEELGKAGSLVYLAAMPDNIREQAPVRRLLEWHQLKLVKGTVLAELRVAPHVVCPALAAGSFGDVAAIMDDAQAFAHDEDSVRLRGLYVDVDRRGQVQEPSEVTAAQVREQLDRARSAASVASELLNPDALDQIANPDPTTIEYSRALIGAFGTIGHDRSPEAAASALMEAASLVCS